MRPRDASHGERRMQSHILLRSRDGPALSTGEMTMTLPANDDFANSELCGAELERVWGGFSLADGGHGGAHGTPHGHHPPQPLKLDLAALLHHLPIFMNRPWI